MDENSNISWKILNTYFNDNPNFLINHHLQSYNDFFDKGINQLLKEKNPIHFFKNQEKITMDHETKYVDELDKSDDPKAITYEEMKEIYPNKQEEEYDRIWMNCRNKGYTKTTTINEYRYQARMYIGGKNGDKLYYGKPIIYNSDKNDRFMYPNEARLKNFTYAFTIHYDVDIEYKLYIPLDDGSDKYKIETFQDSIEKLYLGKFPIMLKSNLCILNNLSPEITKNMGEDPNDTGGYFIIDGKEKAIVSQEKFADNTLYVQKDPNDLVSCSVKLKSVSEDASKPVRNLLVKLIKESPSVTNGQIVVSIPNVRKDIPLFIVMRALGIISDKEIIKFCLLDIDKYENYLDYFRPSVHDAGYIFTQEAAIKYIATFTKGKTASHVMQILMNYFLPHVGELNFKRKAYFLGYMTKRLLMVHCEQAKPTNRDSYVYKRIEIAGTLIYDLFKEYYTLQQNDIFLETDKEYFYSVRKNANSYQNYDFLNIISNNKSKIFKNRVVENGFKRAFKGDWGAEAHTKKVGALQDLTRLSHFATIAQLRKSNTPIGADGAKIVGPRHINSTQWGIFCPIHSPDGGNVGLHKHLSILTHITKKVSGYPFIEYLRNEEYDFKLLEECTPRYINDTTKIFINGAWIGITSKPIQFKNLFILHRRNGLFNIYTSLYWNIELNEIHIQTDAGRPCHPLLYLNKNKISYENENTLKKIETGKLTWEECLLGSCSSSVDRDIENTKILNKDVLTGNLQNNQAIIEYLDTQEMQGVMLASSLDNKDTYIKNKVTHKEIDPSVILSVMANQVIFPSTNPYPRNAFSCGQSKQAVSMFHTNFNNRMDKSSILLNYGQDPIVRSRYYKHVTKNQHPYGTNAIVAIACYSGYNVEDAIIINRASLDRGLFRTTYYNTYESTEEVNTVGNIQIKSEFINIENNNVIGLKPGYDYSQLQENGLIKENSVVDEKTVLIGKGIDDAGEYYSDDSVTPKKGQLGYVDKSFMTETENGMRISKVRIRNDRIPMIGDKFCSRAGQKGTIGIVLDEVDMPHTAEGLRPDIIVNPHALPSRMTIGHLVETLIGKACVLTGSLGDCTAFLNKGPKEKVFGEILAKNNFSSTGNEILYNGMTGEQLETDIYFGPTYYLRLKHMVKDKINYRGKGPRTILTRQTVQGRANDGGLRIGEMDRDAILSHGMKSFITESMMERGDKYFMAICNNTGTIAVYNENKNIFLSPMVDGPLKFNDTVEGGLNIIPISKHGREFSIIRVPYAFKLLYQELLTMNVQMRIITAENVDELTTLKKSDNILKLANLSSFLEVAKRTKNKLNNQEDDSFNTPNEDVKLEQSEQQLQQQGQQEQQQQEQQEQQDNVANIEFNINDIVLITDESMQPDDQWKITGIDGDDVIIENIKDGEVKFKTKSQLEKPYKPDEWWPETPPIGPETPPMGPGTPPMGPGTPPMGPGTPPIGPGTPPIGPGTPPSSVGVPSTTSSRDAARAEMLRIMNQVVTPPTKQEPGSKLETPPSGPLTPDYDPVTGEMLQKTSVIPQSPLIQPGSTIIPPGYSVVTSPVFKPDSSSEGSIQRESGEIKEESDETSGRTKIEDKENEGLEILTIKKKDPDDKDEKDE